MTLTFTHWRLLETGEASVPAQAYRKAVGEGTRKEPSTAGAEPLRPKPERKTAAELGDLENAQLVHAWTAGAHPDASLAEVLADPEPFFEGREDILEHQGGAPIEWWEVVDGETREHGHTLVLWGNDCGALYEADSTEMVAYISQFALWCSKDWRLWKALSLAHRSVATHYPESELARMFVAGSFPCRQKGCRGRATLWKDSDADEGACRVCGASVAAYDY